MTKFIFEDHEDTPVSKLLKAAYNGSNILFAGGNNAVNILNMIQKLRLDKSCRIVVFLDLVPDNRLIYNNYMNLVSTLSDMRIDDVYVVPILCIEYYVIKFLCIYEYIKLSMRNLHLTDKLIFHFDYKDDIVQEFVHKNIYREKSLEHVYKELLNEITQFRHQYCMRNNHAGRCGIFYKKDCSCQPQFCNSKTQDKLGRKAERFYMELPAFEVVDHVHSKILEDMGIIANEKDKADLYKELRNFFNKISDSMGEERVSIISTI